MTVTWDESTVFYLFSLNGKLAEINGFLSTLSVFIYKRSDEICVQINISYFGYANLIEKAEIWGSEINFCHYSVVIRCGRFGWLRPNYTRFYGWRQRLADKNVVDADRVGGRQVGALATNAE